MAILWSYCFLIVLSKSKIMNKAIATLSLATTLLISGFVSCKHETNMPLPDTSAVDTAMSDPVDTGICFTRDILPIFISNCAKSGCHDAASHQEGYVFTSYETITAKKFVPGRPDKTELYEAITEEDEDDIMPQPPNAPLTGEQITLIRNWILQGAPNTSGCGNNCDSTLFTFSRIIQPMVNKYCKGCHNEVLSSGGYNFESYDGILKSVTNRRILGALNHETGYLPMPRGGNKLSDCEISQFRKWIDNGSLNN